MLWLLVFLFSFRTAKLNLSRIRECDFLRLKAIITVCVSHSSRRATRQNDVDVLLCLIAVLWPLVTGVVAVVCVALVAIAAFVIFRRGGKR